MAKQHLPNVMAYLDIPTLGQPEVFFHFKNGMLHSLGTIQNANTQKFLQGFVGR